MTTTAIVERNSLAEFKEGVDNVLDKRTYFMAKILPTLKEGVDYYVINGKKSLGKSGAETLCNIYGLTASFEKDTETLECFKNVADGVIAYKCILRSKSGEFVGEGRGCSTLKHNNGDPNKATKMGTKSAFIDSIVRVAGISGFFSQDLEDMDPNLISTSKPPPAPKPTSEAASIPSRDFFGLVDENAWYPDNEDEDTSHNNERADRPMTEKQKSYLASLIVENVSDPEERERWLQEMQGYRISEASETISSFLMSPRY